MAAGLSPYKHLNVHRFWARQGPKKSNNLGNVISPLDMKQKIGLDAFRYFVLRESVFGEDADFRDDNLIGRYNSDLANNLGNLVSRVLAMQEKYFGGVVQPLGPDWVQDDVELRDKFRSAESALKGFMEDLQFHRALESIWAALDHANR